MSSNQTSPSYKLYFDDIEEIFLNTISFKYLFLSTIITCLLSISSLIILFYRSTTIFLACLVPFIYSIIFYDFVQMLSIVLLKYNLLNSNEKYYSELCRWPYYLKASAEAGQCLTLIFFYLIRCQKVRYFLKHNHLPNSSRIHSRALTFVCLLFIVYVNNWITHLKVEKIHLMSLNESNADINIREYPITLYGMEDVKLNDRRQFYSDLERYTDNYKRNQVRHVKPEKIIHHQKDDSLHEIIIKIPSTSLFRQNKLSTINRTRRKSKRPRQTSNKTIYGKNSYRIHRCTYGQRNFFLANFLTLIHSIFYFLLMIYFLITIYQYRIPCMTIGGHREFQQRALSTGRRKSAERHKQLILLTHLRHFQYIVVYCHTTFILIRLIYVCLLTFILCLVQSPFKWLTMKFFFYSLFFLVYYSIPFRILLLFIYLFLSLFSPYIYSMFYYVFQTKLHFSCKLQKPTIRFRFHIVQYHPQPTNHEGQSTHSLVQDLTSSIYEEQSTMFANESIAIYDDNSSSQNAATVSSYAIVNEIEHVKL